MWIPTLIEGYQYVGILTMIGLSPGISVGKYGQKSNKGGYNFLESIGF